jgi:hypothetical protein
MPTETMAEFYERKWIETGDLNYLELANKLRSKGGE